MKPDILIIDGDYPMAVGAIEAGRDLTLPIEQVRSAERIPSMLKWPDEGTMATLPELRKGRIAAALVKVVACVKKPDHPHGEYRSKENAYAAAMGQLAYYRLLEARNEIKVLDTSEKFSAHMAIWERAEEYEKLPVGFFIGMEGADAITWPDQVHQWYDDGLRVISLSHYGVSYYSHGSGTGTSGGLTPDAKPLLKAMDKLGMILDVTHTSDQSVREEFELFDGPVLASHQNCRALVPGERQQPDDILLEVIRRGGVIGSSMDTWMLNKHHSIDWKTIRLKRRDVFASDLITLEDVVDHMDHVCQLAGNSNHAAIGGDTDGQGGADGAPHDVDTVADYQIIAGILQGRGYSSDDIENIMYKNWQRFFERWLP
jgi:membrane dipeptidase